jgi:hypothetical protein
LEQECEEHSEEQVRFKGKRFVWSLCYLKALKLYKAKQVPFFFIYGSYISPFITTIHFSSLTAESTKYSQLAKKFHLLLSKIIILELKRKYIDMYMQKYPYLFLEPGLTLHTEYGLGLLNHTF